MPAFNDQIVRLYDTVFDRAPDPEGLAFWNASMDQGYSLTVLADHFMRAPEFAATYGQPTNRQFVESVYLNVLDRAGDADGIAFWTAALDEGRAQRAETVIGFSESSEHVVQMAAVAAAEAAARDETTLPETRPGPYEAEFNTQDGQLPPKMFYTQRDGETLVGGAGKDAMFAVGNLNATLWGQAGDDSLAGGPGDDTLHGGGGNDVPSGGTGNDALFGGPGDDALNGGAGADYMAGGAGADRFVFGAAADTDKDYIAGFEVGTDALDFRGLGLVFRGQGAFQADGQAQLRYVDDFTPRAAARSHIPGSTHVYVDADGNGVADAEMTVEHRALVDASFLV